MKEKMMRFFKRKKDNKSSCPEFYYDDPEIGLCKKSSHPTFVKVASDDFYYNCCDDFSPFGNDAGSDTLARLEDWFKDGGRPHAIIRFLRDVIDEWALGVPDNIDRKTDKGLNTWLNKNDMNGKYLTSECRLRVVVAFGQLKICG